MLPALPAGVWSDQHAVPTRLAHCLDHQIFKMLKRIGQPLGFSAEKGFDVVENRFLVEVIADHAGHVRVHCLVVRNPRAGRVGQRKTPGPIDLKQPRNAQMGIGRKALGSIKSSSSRRYRTSTGRNPWTVRI